ncbi:MAG: hypothetical protein RQ936_08575 [Gammaproteobacteria bacterium]|nr:hypothetical protein [Gammaproteobacteria bacterium]
MKHSKNIYFIFLLFCCLPIISHANWQDNDASVFGYAETLNTTTKYIYRVTNVSNNAGITSVTVGYDYFHGVPELKTKPVEIFSPQGWNGKIVRTEETLDYEIKWTSSSASYDIQAGNSLSGFSFTVANEQVEPLFLNAHFTVIYGNSTITSKIIQPDNNPSPVDTVPPSLSVELSPSLIWPPNKKMTRVDATISVHDNEDSNPIVILDSIKCADCDDIDSNVQSADYGTDDREFYVKAERLGKRKEGRVYEIKYTATDYSGNTTTVISNVTIPHDQQK